MNIFPSILRNLLLLIFAFLNTIGFAQKDIKIEIDNYLQKTQKIFEVPGVAVAIVKDRKVIFAKGFGVQSLSKKTPVNEGLSSSWLTANKVDSMISFNATPLMFIVFLYF